MNNPFTNYHYRLIRVILGFFTALGSGALLTWSYYREPLLELFPSWTPSDLSLIFSVQSIMVAVIMACSGFLMQKITTKTGYVIAALCFLVGFGGYNFLPVENPKLAFVLAFICYAIIAPTGCGISCLLNYSVYPAWYPEHSGLISGIMVMGCNTCALITGAIAGLTIPGIGIRRTFLVTAVIVFAVTMISVPLGVFPRPDQELPPAKVRTENRSGRNYTTAEMLRSPIFWIAFIYMTLIFSLGLILADHAASIARFFGAAALFGMLFAPAKGVSCFALGWIMDKISTIGAMLLINVIVIGAAVLLIFAASVSSTVLILTGLTLLGFGMGGVSTVKALSIRFFFGTKYYQQNYGITNLSVGFAALIAYLASKVLEATKGSYNAVFIMILAIGLLALISVVLLGVFMKRRPAE